MAFDGRGQTRRSSANGVGDWGCRADRERGNTDLAAVCETKGIEMRDTDVGTVILHPSVGRRLAGDLLVDGAGMVLLGELVGHRAAEDDAAGRGRAAGPDID